MAGIKPGAVCVPLRRGWLWLVLLSFAMIAAGMAAIIHPLTAMVATLVWLGAVFAIAGAAQLLQVWTARGWRGGLWHIGNGAVYLLGGLLVLFDPLAGAVALGLVVAAVLVTGGALRLLAGFLSRPEGGWLSLAFSGAVAMAAGAALAILPAGQSMLMPGLLVGAALLVEGMVLLALALAARRALRAG